MERKIITEEKKAIIIAMKSSFDETCMTDDGVVFCYSTPVFETYCKLVELDCDTLCRFVEVYSGAITYSKQDGKYIVTCITRCNTEIKETLSMELECDDDFLGLFEKTEADSSLENFFNDSLENVVRKLKETYPDVVESIEQNVISNIRGYDLEDSVKEDIAKEWIEDNPCDSVSVAEDYIGTDDMKDIIIRWFDRNF